MKKAMMIGAILFAGSIGFAKEDAKNVNVDNSGVNTRDARAVTADEQANGSDRDVEITRIIRKDLTSNKDLSVYAHNVKIVTLGGKVFLRGPVNSAAEKKQVAAYAEKAVGAQNVKNEIEVVQK